MGYARRERDAKLLLTLINALTVHVKYWIEQTYGTSCVSVGMPIKREWRKRKWEQKMCSSDQSQDIRDPVLSETLVLALS